MKISFMYNSEQKGKQIQKRTRYEKKKKKKMMIDGRPTNNKQI